MNMHHASRLGWTRSSKEASSDAPAEAADSAQAGWTAAPCRSTCAGAVAPDIRCATSDPGTRTEGSIRSATHPRRSPGLRRARVDRVLAVDRSRRATRRGLLLVAAALLVVAPSLVYADVPMVSITGPENVAEGEDVSNPENADFTVTLTGGTGSAPIIVSYELNGTATAGLDYDTPSGKLTFRTSGTPPTTGTSETLTIPVKQDNVDERDETLVVRLTEAVTTAGTVVIGEPKVATATIKPHGTKTVSVTERVSEPEGEDMEFTVSLSAAAGESLVVRYQIVPGSATAADYTLASASGMVTFAANDAADKMFTVSTVEDNLEEADETFAVRLTLVDPPDDVAFESSTATATIADDDDLTASVMRREENVIEGSDAMFTVTLTRSDNGTATPGAGSQDVVITYTIADTSTATATDDYEVPDGTLTIPAGDTTGNITIHTLSDDVREPDESLIVTLTDATTAGRAVTVGTSQDQESETTMLRDSGATVTVSVADASVEEGMPATLTVTLSGKVSTDVIVDYSTAPGTGATTGDFTAAANEKFTILAGKTTGTISIETIDNQGGDPPTSLAESDETFTVKLNSLDSPPANVGVRLGVSEATATINDNDVPRASVTGPATVAEGEFVEYDVTLRGGARHCRRVDRLHGDRLGGRRRGLPGAERLVAHRCQRDLGHDYDSNHRRWQRQRNLDGDADARDHRKRKGGRRNAKRGNDHARTRGRGHAVGGRSCKSNRGRSCRVHRNPFEVRN